MIACDQKDMRETPPTPQVTPSKRTADGDDQARQVVKRAREAADMATTERKLEQNAQNLRERISTVVLPNGQIYVTIDRFGKNKE